MSQNCSTAVMQRRHEAPDSLDYFPTPPWATRALLEWLLALGYDLTGTIAHEPACGPGHMARPMAEYFADVRASDIHDYDFGDVADFLADGLFAQPGPMVDFTITNPPFIRAEEFIARMVAQSRLGAAVLVRTSFLEGQGRYERLFRDNPPAAHLVFCERVVMWRGLLLDPDLPIRIWDAKQGMFVIKKPTSATSYSWFFWQGADQDKASGTITDWIAPGTRKALTRPGDYPALPDALNPDFPIEDHPEMIEAMKVAA